MVESHVPASRTARHRLPVRRLVAASAGNALEWFDWTIYATFSINDAGGSSSSKNSLYER